MVQFDVGYGVGFSPDGSFARRPGRRPPGRVRASYNRSQTICSCGVSNPPTPRSAKNTHILADCVRECLGPEAIQAAILSMVDFHLKHPFSKHYGDGSVSSSDGQRFAVRESSLYTSYCTRYFGFFKKAISVYTHVADNYGVFSTQILSCGIREAIAVLDGLLSSERVIAPKLHTTDTHGYTDQLFALSYLLGITFAPRLKDLGDLTLYRLSRNQDVGSLYDIFSGVGDLQSIGPYWEDMVRVVSALKEGHVPAQSIMPKLGAASHIDRLSHAFTTLGKVVKTIFLLRYFADKDFRHLIRVQLNKGEHRHSLADHLFFANRGEFRTGDLESLMSQASCLSLVCNAILIWNTVEYDRIVHELKASGFAVQEDLLPHVSPLAFKHIAINGRYEFPEDIDMEVSA